MLCCPHHSRISNLVSRLAALLLLTVGCGTETELFPVPSDTADVLDGSAVADSEEQADTGEQIRDATDGNGDAADAAEDRAPEIDQDQAEDWAPDSQNDFGDITETDALETVACSVSAVAGVCIHVDDCDGDRHSTPGHCPGPAEIQCCTANSSGPGCTADDAPVPNLNFDEPVGTGSCPAGMSQVTDFCMDRYEAFLAEVTDDGLVPWSPYFNPGERTMVALSAPGAVPQGYINRHQAQAACEEARKRLCTRDEWLRACEGPPPGQAFPYGDERVWDRCNDRRSQHPAVEYFGTTESWIYSRIDHSCLNQLPDSLHLTGQNDECINDEGVYDLVGNLHEWTSETLPNGHGVFRGGFYVDTVVNGVGCAYRTVAHWPTHWDYSTGFRCCADLL